MLFESEIDSSVIVFAVLKALRFGLASFSEISECLSHYNTLDLIVRIDLPENLVIDKVPRSATAHQQNRSSRTR